MAAAIAGGANTNSMICAMPAIKPRSFPKPAVGIIKYATGFGNSTCQFSIRESKCDIKNDDKKSGDGKTISATGCQAQDSSQNTFLK